MKEYIVAAIGLVLAGVFGKMWWDERNAERAVLPPSFIESQIKRSEFVPLTEQISKVYAICPKEKRIADYLMSWTARVNYSVTLNELKIEELEKDGAKKWVITSPEIKILNDGSNLIDENDHYKFNNKLLVLMDASAQQEHYKKERKRAENIAKFIALHRIKTDENLKEIIKSQIKLTALGLISQAKDMQAPFSDIEVIIKENEGEITAPVRPRLCEEQPFKTNLGLIELAAAEV